MKAKPTTAKKTSKPKVAPAKAKKAGSTAEGKEGYGITWNVWFRFANQGWSRGRAATDLVVDAVAKTGWWKELDIIGHDRKLGTPRGSVEETKRTIATGDVRDTFTLVRGSERAAIYTDETDAWFTIDISARHLNLNAGARDEVLERMGGAVLSDMIDLVLRLRSAWKNEAHLDYAAAFPMQKGGFDYPRVEPHRSGRRALNAIVDIVDPTYEPYDEEEWRVPESRAIARAKLPKGVTRTERDGAVVLQWIVDPTDLAGVRAAAGRHEAWIVDLVETEEVEDTW